MNLKVSDYMSPGLAESEITVYPQNDIVEIANIMFDTNTKLVKVALSPWNKKCIGFLDFNKIKEFAIQ